MTGCEAQCNLRLSERRIQKQNKKDNIAALRIQNQPFCLLLEKAKNRYLETDIFYFENQLFSIKYPIIELKTLHKLS